MEQKPATPNTPNLDKNNQSTSSEPTKTDADKAQQGKPDTQSQKPDQK